MPNRYKAGKGIVLSRAVCSVTLSYCRTFLSQTSVTTAFSLLLQLLQTDLLFLRGLAEGLWPRGCLDGVLCLPFRTRVKPCPHSQKQSLTTVSVIYPHSLEAVWAPVGSSVQPFPVSYANPLYITARLSPGKPGRETSVTAVNSSASFPHSFCWNKPKLKQHHCTYYGSGQVHVINLQSS